VHVGVALIRSLEAIGGSALGHKVAVIDAPIVGEIIVIAMAMSSHKNGDQQQSIVGN
jgi:hypothetical protein